MSIGELLIYYFKNNFETMDSVKTKIQNKNYGLNLNWCQVLNYYYLINKFISLEKLVCQSICWYGQCEDKDPR
jgi:hypothetical protein